MNAQQIAARIQLNCERYHGRVIDHATWDAEQRRLWDLARRRRCDTKVCRLVAPPLAVVKAA